MLFVRPVVAVAGYLPMLRARSIQLIGWVTVAGHSLDCSLGNTSTQALWLPARTTSSTYA